MIETKLIHIDLMFSLRKNQFGLSNQLMIIKVSRKFSLILETVPPKLLMTGLRKILTDHTFNSRMSQSGHSDLSMTTEMNQRPIKHSEMEPPKQQLIGLKLIHTDHMFKATKSFSIPSCKQKSTPKRKIVNQRLK